MFNIKRALVAAAAITAIFTLSACGGSETPAPSTPPSSSQTQEPVEQLANLSNLNGELNIVNQERTTDEETGDELIRVRIVVTLPVTRDHPAAARLQRQAAWKLGNVHRSRRAYHL